jgi:nuclear pore complex protein Nup205
VAGTLTTETTPQLDDDELFTDLALEGCVFHALPDLLLLSAVSSEEFYQRRLHILLTDFLALMPLRIKELRNRADEAARNKLMHEQEGIQYAVPSGGQHFGQLLLTLGTLYAGDPLELGLSAAFWCPLDSASGVTAGTELVGGSSRHLPAKQVALYKFVRLAGDLLMPSLFIPYVRMLAGLADNPVAAPHCFSLLKVNSAGGGGSSNVSLDHFFFSLAQYHQNLRQETAPSSAAAASALGLDHPIYRTKPLTRGISPQEVEGLAAVLDLVTVLAQHSDLVRLSLAEHPNWALVPTILGLLGCAVPCTIKSRLMLLLAALARSPDLVHPLWLAVEQAQLLSGPNGSSSNGRAGGMAGELEEVETRAEEFPLTRAFIQLLDRLTDVEIPSGLGAGTRAPCGILPYLNFVQDAVFLRFSTRTYRNPAEKWEVAAACLSKYLLYPLFIVRGIVT